MKMDKDNVDAIIDRTQNVELSLCGKMIDQAILNIPSAYPTLSLERLHEHDESYSHFIGSLRR